MIPQPLGAERLAPAIPIETLPASTAEIAPLEAVTGQDRAQQAIAFGLGLDGDGFNIAVAGVPASGRSTAVRQLVAAAAAKRQPPSDWVYLHSFADPTHPRVASLPAGAAGRLQKELSRLADACRVEVPRAFENDSYQQRRERLLEPLEQARNAAMEELARFASLRGFAVNMTPMGFVATPLGKDGRPMPPELIASLPDDLRSSLQQRGEQIEEKIVATVREVRRLDAAAHDQVEALDAEVARFVVGHLLSDLRTAYGGYGLLDHFDAIEADIIANLERFKQITPAMLREAPAQVAAQLTEEREAILRRYTVNPFVTRAEGAAGAPLVEERNPTYRNLLGHIDYEARLGSLVTDFTHIRAGAMHRANGGYLVLDLDELMADPRAWVMLKRAMKTRELRVEGIGDPAFPLPAVTLAPEPIPFSARVVVIGEPTTVALFELLDADFARLFKLRAEFEPDIPLDAEGALSYAAFARRVSDTCEAGPFERGAIAELIRFGSRQTGRQDRLTTRFGAIADLCLESAHLAALDGAATVTAAHVADAVRGRRERSSMAPDRLRRMIVEGTLRIDTEGTLPGQVNGLAVYQVGAFAFGTPMRISCRTGAGRRGVVAIEREVERSGAIHSKGVLVLSGYLTGTFGATRPLAFTASLTFEQSYDEVEGDSASSAELYAILCSLAGVAVRQDLAVTGSVDQFGRVQAVGGVTEKVEGFFDLCQARGLTGSQGVIIPAANVINLVLRANVIDAVRAGRFSIWPVTRVEEGLELLTGIAAGERTSFGTYAPGTVFRRVADTLEALSPASQGAEAAE